MARVYNDQVRQSIEWVRDELVGWHMTEGTRDSVARQIRPNRLAVASTVLGDLVRSVQPDNRLIFTVGRTPLVASRFTRREYDTLGEHFEGLNPGQPLVLERAAYYTDTSPMRNIPETRELYVGNFDLVLAVSGLARSLNEQGTLALVTADEAQHLTDGV